MSVLKILNFTADSSLLNKFKNQQSAQQSGCQPGVNLCKTDYKIGAWMVSKTGVSKPPI